MKEREIQVTRDQIHKLITEVRALPGTPVGDHLSDDEFIGYAMETLEPQQFERIDGHLASCPECATEMERLVEASEVWRGEQGEQRLAELEARTIEKTKLEVVAGEGGDLINSKLREESPPKPVWKPPLWRQFLQKFWSPKAIPQGLIPIISELAHGLVTELAPHELPLFRTTWDAFIKDLKKWLKGPGRTAEMLAFGLDTKTVSLTPAVLVVTAEVVQFVTERVRESFPAARTEDVTAHVEEMLIGPALSSAGRKAPPPLASEQLVQIRQLAFERASRSGLPEEQARRLADALAEHLAGIGA